jgi:hypothetical protein
MAARSAIIPVLLCHLYPIQRAAEVVAHRAPGRNLPRGTVGHRVLNFHWKISA